MKKSFFCFVLPCAMMLGATTGCSNPQDPSVDPQVVESLTVNPKTLAFNKDAASKNFAIESNSSWTITCSDTWVTTPEAGAGNHNAVKVSVLDNQLSAIRTANITIKTEGGKEETVQVTQGGCDPYMFVDISIESEGEATIDGVATEIPVTVTASGAWTPTSNAGWVTIEPKSETQAVIVVVSNKSEDERSAVITFHLDGTDVKRTFKLTQGGLFINIGTPTAATVASTGEEITLTVTASSEWTATKNQNWITVSQEGDQAIITVDPNNTAAAREAVVTFTLNGTDVKQDFNLTQKLPSISIDPQTATASVVEVAVNATGAWTAQSNQSWVTIKQTDEYAVLVAEENTTGTRVAEITFKLNNLDVTKTFTLTQNITTWEDFTEQAGLKNYEAHFTTDGTTFIASHAGIAQWTITSDVAMSGNLNTDLDCIAFWTWPGIGSVYSNGKMYQTVTLEKGTYKFNAVAEHSNPGWFSVYVTAAPGNSLPDFANVEKEALGFAKITNVTVTDGAVYSAGFILSARSTVSLGFNASVNSFGQIYFHKVVLLKQTF